MKTKYTKKQISEAIRYWTKQLKKMNESMNHTVEIKLEDFGGYASVPDECDWVNIGILNDEELEKFKKFVVNWNNDGFDPNFEKYANKAKTAYVKSVQDDWNSSEYCEDYDSPADAWDDAWGQSEADMGYIIKVDNKEIEL